MQKMHSTLASLANWRSEDEWRKECCSATDAMASSALVAQGPDSSTAACAVQNVVQDSLIMRRTNDLFQFVKRARLRKPYISSGCNIKT